MYFCRFAERIICTGHTLDLYHPRKEMYHGLKRTYLMVISLYPSPEAGFEGVNQTYV
jgi:hypothetical protein